MDANSQLPEQLLLSLSHCVANADTVTITWRITSVLQISHRTALFKTESRYNQDMFMH